MVIEQNKNMPWISTSNLVLLDITQSTICNLQSAIHGRPSERPRLFLQQAQDRLPLGLTGRAGLRAGLNGIEAGTEARPTGSNTPAVARWQVHLHGFATAIRETSGLARKAFPP